MEPGEMTEEELTALCADVVALMSSRGATIQNGIEVLSRLMASTALAATETRFAAADMVEGWMTLLATSLRDQSISITEHSVAEVAH